MKAYTLLSALFLFLSFSAQGQDAIRLNQLGYHPQAAKTFVVAMPSTATTFKVVQNGTTVFEGTLSEVKSWEMAGEEVRQGDFSEVQTPGTYTLQIEGVGSSHPFQISTKIYSELLPASVRAYYYLRSGTSLPEEFAGKWHRKAGHPDLNVPFHPDLNRAGTMDSPKGWYDAGDYGKYVVNGAFSVGQLLLMHERYPEALKDGTMNIPESGNGISDLLDEIKYETDWLLTMQDDDGGVFHKLTCENFVGMVMPEEANCERLVMAKGVGGTLDFAAVMAKMYRAYGTIDETYAQQCLEASKKAWQWALKHPQLEFKNPKGVITGEYGDNHFSEEWFWAAAELFRATQGAEYLDYLKAQELSFEYSYGDGWRKFMELFGVFTLLDKDSNLPEDLKKTYEKGLVNLADALLEKSKSLDYHQAVDSYQWGSNSDIQNTVVVMAEAHCIQPKSDYVWATQSALDYLLGKNATSYSFITGFGSKPPKKIHHRPSEGDGIEDPVPGYVVGGPNMDRQDSQYVDYGKDVTPMKAWRDEVPSFASNEICINWNCPLPYVIAFYETSLQQLEK